ncbi:hypothetical protein GOV10_02595 [Candidatus Woesearchaeota archaeon]|nr:hypothetical protein [Candidatus Woesearchaeota archaeon]
MGEGHSNPFTSTPALAALQKQQHTQANRFAVRKSLVGCRRNAATNATMFILQPTLTTLISY